MKRIVESLIVFLLLLPSPALRPDEGMYPISEIAKLNLAERGLEVQAEDIFNPKGIGLIDAIVQLSGGTGSFVSSEGLIITNHHIAFGAIQAASSKEHDYLTSGFLAASRRDEIQAKAYTARITESYQDVSAEVLGAVKAKMDFALRTRQIEKKIKEIVLEAEKRNPGKRAEVSEMFPGKTYILFLYTFLRDVRLVYAPPRGIGDFGGEDDNWMWPRHTGDFSFLRAYVGPDGKPADYSPANIPYTPRNHLKIAATGVKEGEAIFILGYPGRTYRHMTSHYLDSEERMRMPYVADLYAWQIKEMERMGAADPAVSIRLSARIKGLANTMKNYSSKLKGMKRLGMVERRREQESQIARFIAGEKALSAERSIFAESEALYKEAEPWLEHEMILEQLPRMVALLGTAMAITESAVEREKKENERESAYMTRNFPRTRERLKVTLANYYAPADKLFFCELLRRAAALPADKRIPALDRIISGKDPLQAGADFIDQASAKTQLADPAVVDQLMEKPRSEVEKSDDSLITLARELLPSIQKLRELLRQRKGKLDLLYSRLFDVERLYHKSDFIPDANGTLRFTSGHISGYSPADGVWYGPITTYKGILEKTTGQFPFQTPSRSLELLGQRDFGRFVIPGTELLPVAILYDADTTGGNSGSPVLDRRGQLVGINFDRTSEATINDYAWSRDYSRSIAVDIRYVLWVTSKVAGAGHLLAEMGMSE